MMGDDGLFAIPGTTARNRLNNRVEIDYILLHSAKTRNNRTCGGGNEGIVYKCSTCKVESNGKRVQAGAYLPSAH